MRKHNKEVFVMFTSKNPFLFKNCLLSGLYWMTVSAEIRLIRRCCASSKCNSTSQTAYLSAPAGLSAHSSLFVFSCLFLRLKQNVSLRTKSEERSSVAVSSTFYKPQIFEQVFFLRCLTSHHYSKPH